MSKIEDISIEDLVNERFKKSRCPKQTNDEEKALDEVAEEATAAVNYSIDAENAKSEHAKEVFEDIKNEELVHMGENLEVASKENPEVKDKVMEGVEEASGDKIELSDTIIKARPMPGGSLGDTKSYDMSITDRWLKDMQERANARMYGGRYKNYRDKNSSLYATLGYRDNGRMTRNLRGASGIKEKIPYAPISLQTNYTDQSVSPQLMDVLRVIVKRYNRLVNEGMDHKEAIQVFKDDLAELSANYLNGNFKYNQPSRNIIKPSVDPSATYPIATNAGSLPRIFIGSDYGRDLENKPHAYISLDDIKDAEKEGASKEELDEMRKIHEYQESLRNAFAGRKPVVGEDGFTRYVPFGEKDVDRYRNNIYRTKYNEEHDRQTSAFRDILELLMYNYKDIVGIEDETGDYDWGGNYDWSKDDLYQSIKDMQTNTNKNLGKIRTLGFFRDILNALIIDDEDMKEIKETAKNNGVNEQKLIEKAYEETFNNLFDWHDDRTIIDVHDPKYAAANNAEQYKEKIWAGMGITRKDLYDLSKGKSNDKVAGIIDRIRDMVSVALKGEASYEIGNKNIKVNNTNVDDMAKYLLYDYTLPIVTDNNKLQANIMIKYLADKARESGMIKDKETGAVIEPTGDWLNVENDEETASVEDTIAAQRYLSEIAKNSGFGDVKQFSNMLTYIADTGHAPTVGHDSTSSNNFWQSDIYKKLSSDMQSEWDERMGGTGADGPAVDIDPREIYTMMANRDADERYNDRDWEMDESQETPWQVQRELDRIDRINSEFPLMVGNRDKTSNGYLLNDLGDKGFIRFAFGDQDATPIVDENGNLVDGIFDKDNNFIGADLEPGKRVRLTKHANPEAIKKLKSDYDTYIGLGDSENAKIKLDAIKSYLTGTYTKDDAVDKLYSLYDSMESSLPTKMRKDYGAGAWRQADDSVNSVNNIYEMVRHGANIHGLKASQKELLDLIKEADPSIPEESFKKYYTGYKNTVDPITHNVVPVLDTDGNRVIGNLSNRALRERISQMEMHKDKNGSLDGFDVSTFLFNPDAKQDGSVPETKEDGSVPETEQELNDAEAVKNSESIEDMVKRMSRRRY